MPVMDATDFLHGFLLVILAAGSLFMALCVILTPVIAIIVRDTYRRYFPHSRRVVMLFLLGCESALVGGIGACVSLFVVSYGGLVPLVLTPPFTIFMWVSYGLIFEGVGVIILFIFRISRTRAPMVARNEQQRYG